MDTAAFLPGFECENMFQAKSEDKIRLILLSILHKFRHFSHDYGRFDFSTVCGIIYAVGMLLQRRLYGQYGIP